MRGSQWTLVMMLSAGSLVASAEPAGARHYDRQLGVSLDLPAQWTVSHSDVPGISRFHGGRCSAEDTPVQKCREFVVLIRSTAQEGETSEAAYRRRMRPWKMLTEGRIVVDGETVPWGVMDYGDGRTLPMMRLFTVVVVRDRKCFEFTGWSRPESYASAEASFRDMARSLAFP